IIKLAVIGTAGHYDCIMLGRGLIYIYPVSQMMFTYKIPPVVLSPVYHYGKHLNALVFPFSLVHRIQLRNGFFAMTTCRIPETDQQKLKHLLVCPGIQEHVIYFAVDGISFR